MASGLTRVLLQWNWEQGLIHCPNQVAVPFEVGRVVHFPTDVCASCPLRDRAHYK